jgi:TRAP-type C4-dicarboxylate transport system substrate-binding protein
MTVSFQKVAVIGAGAMGRGIAQIAAQAGSQVWLYDTQPEAIAKARVAVFQQWDKLQEKGIVGIAYWELGFRNMTNSKRAINKVEDLAGLKIRVIPNPINLDWVKALDANPTPMAFGEVYGAMESKAIDGQENPPNVILANKFAEVQKHLTLTNHVYNPQSVIVSKKFWDGLNAAEKKIITDAVAEATQTQRKVARDAASGNLADLKKAGMQVTELPAAEMTKLRDKMKPVIAKYSASVGEATVNEMMAELAKQRR